MEQGDEQQRLSNAALQEACSAPEDSEESSGSPVPGPGRSRREEGFQTRRRRRRPAWSRLEEAILAKQHSIRGNSWSAIAEHLPGRSASEVKNIWHSTLRSKKLRARSLLRAYARAISERGDSTQARLEAFRWAVKVTKGGSDDLPLGTGVEGGVGDGADYGEHLSAGSEGEDTDPLLAMGGPALLEGIPLAGSVGTDADELRHLHNGPPGGGEPSQDSQPESQQPSGADAGQVPLPRRRRTHVRNNRLTTQSVDAADSPPQNAGEGADAADLELHNENPNPARCGFMGEDRGGQPNVLALVEYMGAEVEDQHAKYFGSEVGDQVANGQVPDNMRRPYLPPRQQRPVPASFGGPTEAVHNTRRQTQLKQQRGQESHMHQRPPKQPRRQEDDRGGDGGFGSRLPRGKEPPASMDPGLEGQQALAQLQMLYLQAAIERRCAAAALEALPPAVIARRLLEEEAQAEAYRMLLRQRLMTRAQEYELEQLCGLGPGAEGCNPDLLGRIPGEARGTEAPQDWQQGNKRGVPSQGPEQQSAQAAANGAAGPGRAPSPRNHMTLPLGNMDPLSAAVANLAGAGNFGLGAAGLGMAGLGAAGLGATGLGAAGLGAAGLSNLGLVLSNLGLGRAGLGGLGINPLTGAPDLGLSLFDQLNALLGSQRVGMERLMAENPLGASLPTGPPMQSGRPPRGSGAQKRGWDGQQANPTGAQGMDFDTRSRDGEPYEGYPQQDDKAPPPAAKARGGAKRRPDTRDVDGAGSPYDAAKQGLPHSLAVLLYGKGGDPLEAGLYGAGLPAWPMDGSMMDWAGASMAMSLQRGRPGGYPVDARARSAAAWNADAAGHASEDEEQYEVADDEALMQRQRGLAMGGRDMGRYRRPGRNMETDPGYDGAQSDDDQYYGAAAPRQRGRSMGAPGRPRFRRPPATSYDVDAYAPEDGEPHEDGFYHRGMPADAGGSWHRGRATSGPRYRRAVREAEEADLDYEADDPTGETLALRQRSRSLGGPAAMRQRPSAGNGREHAGPELEGGEMFEEGGFPGRAGGGATGARHRSHPMGGFAPGRAQRPMPVGLHEEGLQQELDTGANETAAGDGDARRQRGHVNGGPRHRQVKQPYTEDRKQAEIEQDAAGVMEDRRYDGMADEEPAARQRGRPSGSHGGAARSRAATAAGAAHGKGEADFEQAGGAPADDGLYQGMPGDTAALRMRSQGPGGGTTGSRFRPKQEPTGTENGNSDVPMEDGYPQGRGRLHDAAAAPRQRARPPSGPGAARYRASLPDADGVGLELEDGPPVDDGAYQEEGDAAPRRRGRGTAGRGGARARPSAGAKHPTHEASGEGEEGGPPQRRRGPGNGYGGGRGSGAVGRGMSNAGYEQDGSWQQYRSQSQEGHPQSQQPSADFDRRDLFDTDAAVGDVAHALLSIGQHLPHSLLPGGVQSYPPTIGTAAGGAGRRPSATGTR